MICDICKQNEATVHITKIVNGVKQELNVCENCAREMDYFNFGSEMQIPGIIPSAFTFPSILSGIMDYINQNAQNSGETFDIVCKNCNTPYSEFAKTGFLGCSECYKNFAQTLMPVIKRIQGNVEHAGKIPGKTGKDIIDKRKLIKLKEDLKKAIELEEYEKAAKIRDSIRELQKNMQG